MENWFSNVFFARCASWLKKTVSWANLGPSTAAQNWCVSGCFWNLWRSIEALLSSFCAGSSVNVTHKAMIFKYFWRHGNGGRNLRTRRIVHVLCLVTFVRIFWILPKSWRQNYSHKEHWKMCLGSQWNLLNRKEVAAINILGETEIRLPLFDIFSVGHDC